MKPRGAVLPTFFDFGLLLTLAMIHTLPQVARKVKFALWRRHHATEHAASIYNSIASINGHTTSSTTTANMPSSAKSFL